MQIPSGSDATTRPRPAHDTTPGARPALLPPDPLAALQQQFPRYRIWQEDICDRARYIARSLEHGLRPHTVITATPTGHRYRSTAPPVLPGAPPGQQSPLERHLETLLAA